MNPAEARALYQRLAEIPGWFDLGMASVLAFLDEVQRNAGVVGNGFEIGVFCGRSAGYLGSLLDQERESFGVCDIFEEQALNVSGSTRGSSLAAFQKNMARFRFRAGFLKIHHKSSSELTPEDMGGPVRLFHIDGGHLAEEALGDLRRAARSLAPKGCIVLDDAFRHDWPGVTEGAIAFLHERPDFAPLIAGHNKLVLVRKEAEALYRREFARGGVFDRYFPLNPGTEAKALLEQELCGRKLFSLTTWQKPRPKTNLRSRLGSLVRAVGGRV